MNDFKFIEDVYVELIERFPDEVIDLTMMFDRISELHPNFLIFYGMDEKDLSQDQNRNTIACEKIIEIEVNHLHKKYCAKADDLFTNQIQIDFEPKYLQKRYKLGSRSIPINKLELNEWKELYDKYQVKERKAKRQKTEVAQFVKIKFNVDIDKWTIEGNNEELRTTK